MERRPPRHGCDQSPARCSLWQLTTRPPRASTNGWGSGSQLPVEARGSVFVRAGRTAVGARRAQVELGMSRHIVPGPGTLRVGRVTAVHREAGSAVGTSGRGRTGSRSAGGSAACGEARGGGLAGSGALDLGRGIGRVADRCRHRRRRARWYPTSQVTPLGDHDRAWRARRLVGCASRAPRPSMEIGARARARTRAVDGHDALRAWLHEAATRPGCLAQKHGAAGRRDRRERQPAPRSLQPCR